MGTLLDASPLPASTSGKIAVTAGFDRQPTAPTSGDASPDGTPPAPGGAISNTAAQVDAAEPPPEPVAPAGREAAPAAGADEGGGATTTGVARASSAPAPPDRGSPSTPQTVVATNHGGVTPPVTATVAPLPAGCAVELMFGATPIVGTGGDDLLAGTPEADYICGLGGSDTIRGDGGDDRIDGGDGDDTIDGGAGDDILGGGAGNDALSGGEGNDCLGGGVGDDRLDGGPGDDILDAQGGSDTLSGGPGVDLGSPALDDQELEDIIDGVGAYTPEGCLVGSLGFADADDDGLGDVFNAVVRQVRTVRTKLVGLAGGRAQPATRPQPLVVTRPRPLVGARPQPLAVTPLARPLALENGVARVRVTCRGSFTTSQGALTLTTFPNQADRRPRALGSSTRFVCTAANSTPVVHIELPTADRRLIERLGRLRVRATAVAEDAAGRRSGARSVFTLVPERE